MVTQQTRRSALRRYTGFPVKSGMTNGGRGNDTLLFSVSVYNPKRVDVFAVLLIYDVDHVLVHAPFHFTKDPAFLIEGAGKSHGLRHQGLFVGAGFHHHVVRFHFGGAIALSCVHHFLEFIFGNGFPAKRHHARYEGNAYVDLGKEKESLIGPHEAEITGQGQNSPACYGMSVDRAKDRHRKEEYPFENIVQTIQETADRLMVLCGHTVLHPDEVYSLGPAFRISGNN